MKITNEAKTYIEALMQEHSTTNIKIFASGVGWGGPQLGLALDAPAEDDIVEEVNGISVAFDKLVYGQTDGMSLDFKDTDDGGGLVMNSQNGDCC